MSSSSSSQHESRIIEPTSNYQISRIDIESASDWESTVLDAFDKITTESHHPPAPAPPPASFPRALPPRPTSFLSEQLRLNPNSTKAKLEAAATRRQLIKYQQMRELAEEAWVETMQIKSATPDNGDWLKSFYRTGGGRASSTESFAPPEEIPIW